MTDLLILYAKHESRGNIRPDEKQDGIGRAANVTCLGCGEPLQHRRTGRSGRRAHYAHLSTSDTDSASCAESAMHVLVKDMIASLRGTDLELPDWYHTPILFSPHLSDTEKEVRTPDGRPRKPDVVFENAEGQRLAIEVCVSNPKDLLTIADYKRMKLPTVEIRVSLDDGGITESQLRELLRGSEWLVEPFEPFYSENPPKTEGIWFELFQNAYDVSVALRCEECEQWMGTDELDSFVICSCGGSDYRLTLHVGDLCSVAEVPLEVSDNDDLWTEIENKALAFRSAVTPCKDHQRANWGQHYRRSMSNPSNWTSDSALPGVRIILFREWRWRFGIVPVLNRDGRPASWRIWSQGHFVSPIEALKVAEPLACSVAKRLANNREDGCLVKQANGSDDQSYYYAW